MRLEKKFASGLMHLVFIVTEESAKLLLDNFSFDGVMLVNTATNTIVELEVADLNLEQMVLLGDDEQDDLKLA